MAEALWFRPVCDDLLQKIANWFINYERGEIFSTRAYLDKYGGLTEKTIKQAYRIAIKPLEMEHLVKILQALAPKSPLTGDLAGILASMRRRFKDIPLKNRPMLLVSGEWVIKLAYYRADVQDIVTTLLEAKTGKIQNLAAVLEEQKKAGKEMFEL
jgi:hypothetical protein